MSGHNIMDEGIIKDLERLSEEDPDGFSADVLAYINRQKAEIERLEGDLIEERTRRKNAVDAYHEVKAKAGKEIDKLKGVISLLERDIADRDKMLESKVEEVYADFMRDYKEMRAELEDLLDSGALIPPVKTGQTVYAALTYFDECEPPFIEEYTVDGVGYIDGAWYVWSNRDTDWYKVGDEFCKLTREEAEAAIAAARSAADIKDGHKNGGTE